MSDNEIIEKFGMKEFKRLSWFCNSTYPHTRDYLINHLLIKKDLADEYKNKKGLILKEDIIEAYYESRKGEELPPYDFSRMPDILLGKKEKFIVFVNYISPKTKKLVGEWKTCFHDLIGEHEDNGVISGVRAKRFFALTTEDFIERSKALFPGHVEYDKAKYVNLSTKLTLFCNRCGTYFDQTPAEHLNSTHGYCPKCAMEICGEEKVDVDVFKNRIIEYYGEGYWDLDNINYVNSRVPVTLTRVSDKRQVTKIPYNFIKNLDLVGNSSGESSVLKWILSKNLSYIHGYMIKYPGIGRHSDRVYIDFKVTYGDTDFYIEYNGIQHYKYASRKDGTGHYHKTLEDYYAQLRRDASVKDYMNRFSYNFIEIPYIYTDDSEIAEILDDIIISGKLERCAELSNQVTPETYPNGLGN